MDDAPGCAGPTTGCPPPRSRICLLTRVEASGRLLGGDEEFVQSRHHLDLGCRSKISSKSRHACPAGSGTGEEIGGMIALAKIPDLLLKRKEIAQITHQVPLQLRGLDP